MGGGPPDFPQGSTCLVVLWILPAAYGFRLRGFHPLRLAFPKPFAYPIRSLYAVRNPSMHARWFRALPISLAATPGIDVSFSSSGYLDVSVPRVPLIHLWIQCMMTEVCSAGFPHSEIAGSKDICSSPTLIAAYHVFHRLSVPRHPPCALCSMTTSLYSVTTMGRSFFIRKKCVVKFKSYGLMSYHFQYVVFKVHDCEHLISL